MIYWFGVTAPPTAYWALSYPNPASDGLPAVSESLQLQSTVDEWKYTKGVLGIEEAIVV